VILDTIWPETISAGDSLFKIINFVYNVISKIFTVMNQFEIFPGVRFLDFVIAVTIINLLLSFFVQNFWSDAISHYNWIDRFGNNEPTKEEYVGKHEYKPKHVRKEK